MARNTYGRSRVERSDEMKKFPGPDPGLVILMSLIVWWRGASQQLASSQLASQFRAYSSLRVT